MAWNQLIGNVYEEIGAMINRKFFSQFQRGENLAKLSQVYHTQQICTVKLSQPHSIYAATWRANSKAEHRQALQALQTALLFDIKWTPKGTKQGRSMFLNT